jgi:hypothetical protein
VYHRGASLRRQRSEARTARTSRPLETGARVWTALERYAGLNIELYDAGVDTSIRHSLHLPQKGTLLSRLRERQIDSTALIEAFFCAVAPYVVMYSELLTLFEEIGAQKGANNLRIQFDFGHPSLWSWSFDLHTFRDQVEQWQRAIRPTRSERWTVAELWRLQSLLADRSPSRLSTRSDRRLSTWLRNYEANRWAMVLPLPPQVDDSELATALRRLWGLWTAFVNTARRCVAPRESFAGHWAGELIFSTSGVQIADEDKDGTANLKLTLAGMNHDRWPASVASEMFSFATRFRAREPEALRVARALIKQLAEKPVDSRNPESLEQDLKYILALPVWKHRHELYALWVFARMCDAIRDFAVLEFAVEQGVFHIPFKAKRLAASLNTKPTLEIWAELKFPLARPIGKGRKRNVQPDYTVRAGNTAFMLVECKQYFKASATRFREVIEDYSRATPQASVILVNYGPTGNAVVPKAFTRRAKAIGDLHPACERNEGDRPHSLTIVKKRHSPELSLVDFRESVRKLVEAQCASQVLSSTENTRPEWHDVSAVIQLAWDASPRDLDLYLIFPSCVREAELNFQNPGSLGIAPFAELRRDITTGYGPETIQIVKAMPVRYRVLVHAYSQDQKLACSGAVVTFKWHTASQQFTCPSNGDGRWWMVADINLVTGESQCIGRLSIQKPRGPV